MRFPSGDQMGVVVMPGPKANRDVVLRIKSCTQMSEEFAAPPITKTLP
jgi:hypothetical protein